MAKLLDAKRVRTSARPIEPIFLERWSPRAMSGEALAADDLATLLEAARWAPSTYNEQEWRFVYAYRDTAAFEKFFDFLMDANKAWCVQASVLLIVLSHKVFSRNGKPNPVHTLDTGMAVQNFLLQAAAMGLVGHGMAGFDQNAVREQLNIPDDYAVECMLAVGHPGNTDSLPSELREREQPSDRNPVAEFAAEGNFSFP